jgi:glutamate---cysteine ligase / carboxylate-amine ligase
VVGAPSFTVGIEEEYLLVDRASRDLIREAPAGLFEECERRMGRRVVPEFLQSQVEVGTSVCRTIAEAREDLAALRGVVSAAARDRGLAIIAASTHPFASWGEQRTTPKERYRMLADDLQEVARRLVISGMHVHVGIEDEDLRVELMGQATYFLPHLLALSTSSPFWHGHKTGLMSYRIAIWDELPRTGLPDPFESYAAYRRHVTTLVDAGLIEDGTKLWWDIRPSARFPTLEMRITDVCTRLEDAICVAALYVCILRMLYRLRRQNQRWRLYSNMLIGENRWLSQRYGVERGLVDFGRGAIVPYAELLEELLSLVREDAEHLGCPAEVEHARTIAGRGTSAHRQIEAYDRALAAGASEKEALQAVVDRLAEETLLGVPTPEGGGPRPRGAH